MRYKITLKVVDHHPVIPINYQYELSSCILRFCRNADVKYHEFLHNAKLTTQRKKFKLFSFSNLYVPRREIFADRLQILSPEISFILSFYLHNIAESFVKEMFLGHTFSLGDRFSRTNFRVENVEMLPLHIPYETVTLKTLSPLLMSKVNNRGNVDFLPPDYPEYKDRFLHTLLTKYVQVLNETRETPGVFLQGEMNFCVNRRKKIRSRLITIKAHTPYEAQIRGFLFEFDLTAPKDIIELGLLAGFGEKNRLGFGACDMAGNR